MSLVSISIRELQISCLLTVKLYCTASLQKKRSVCNLIEQQYKPRVQSRYITVTGSESIAQILMNCKRFVCSGSKGDKAVIVKGQCIVEGVCHLTYCEIRGFFVLINVN